MDAIDRVGATGSAQLSAPDDAKFRLVIIDKTKESKNPSAVQFLSDDLDPVARRPGPTDYDQRERPWYQDAYEPTSGLLTNHTYSFRRGRRAIRFDCRSVKVVAGDVFLSEAQTMLRKQQMGWSGQVFLFDEEGRVLAHPDMARLMAAARAQGRGDGLPRLADIDTIGMSGAIGRRQQSGSSQQFFDEGRGRTYAAAFRPVAIAGSDHKRGRQNDWAVEIRQRQSIG